MIGVVRTELEGFGFLPRTHRCSPQAILSFAQGKKLVLPGDKGQLRTALKAATVLEKNQRLTDAAVEGFHFSILSGIAPGRSLVSFNTIVFAGDGRGNVRLRSRYGARGRLHGLVDRRAGFLIAILAPGAGPPNTLACRALVARHEPIWPALQPGIKATTTRLLVVEGLLEVSVFCAPGRRRPRRPFVHRRE